MIMEKYIYILGLLLFFISCSSEMPERIDDGNKDEIVVPAEKERVFKSRENVVLSENERAMSSLQNEFSFSLFKKLQETNGDRNTNLIISPFSAHSALSMLANGLDEGAVKNVVDILLPEKVSLNELNAFNKHLFDALPLLDNFTDLYIANSLWYHNGLVLNDAFIRSLKDSYYAEVAPTDLSSEEGKKRINSWIEEKTAGLIPDFFKNPPYCSMTLVNAVYFRAPWKMEFRDVVEREFVNSNGTKVMTKMMTNKGSYDIFISDKYSVLSLPYGNGAFRLNIILPGNPKDMEMNISPGEWKDMSAGLSPKDVEVFLPLFEVSDHKNLLDILKRLGLSELFKGGNLSTISTKAEDVGAVFQEVVFRINEKGSEGVAATGIKASTLDVNSLPVTYERFNVDRPFMFILDEVSTGTILFMGRINSL